MKTLNKITTGFAEIDKETDDLNSSKLYMLSTKSSSEIICEIISNVAITFDFPVALFSYTLKTEQIIKKLISNESAVETQNKKLKNKEWRRLANAMTLLADTKIFISEKDKTIDEIKTSVLGLNDELNGDLKLIIINDFLEKISQNKISEEIMLLNNFSKEIDIPILLFKNKKINIQNFDVDCKVIEL